MTNKNQYIFANIFVRFLLLCMLNIEQIAKMNSKLINIMIIKINFARLKRGKIVI